jgi:hypothetical protein
VVSQEVLVPIPTEAKDMLSECLLKEKVTVTLSHKDLKKLENETKDQKEKRKAKEEKVADHWSAKERGRISLLFANLKESSTAISKGYNFLLNNNKIHQ